jgi:pimeloyl-ACP methyl ester carboxylesterase
MTKQKHFYLIRGLVREKGHWGPFLDEMKKTFPNALITTLEIPGAGEYFKSPSPLSIREMVEQMRRDYLKAKQAHEHSHLIAISLGGMISVEWMKAYPKDFEQASLINTSFGGISPLFERIRPRAFLFLTKVFFLKGRAKESRILELVTNDRSVFNNTLDMWEKIERERPVSTQNALRQLYAAATFKMHNFRPKVPTEVLASTFDRMVNVNCSREIARLWKLPIIEHPTGGHDLTVDDPKWVALRVKKFTAEL